MPSDHEIRTATTLRSKRDQIQAAIHHYEKRLNQARADLAAVCSAIRIFEDTGEGKQVLAYTDLYRLFKRGESTRMCYDALAAGPKTTRELARYVMTQKGMDVHDAVLCKAVSLRLVHALAVHCKQGRILDGGRAKGGVRIWRLP
jgi:hypothetical protein